MSMTYQELKLCFVSMGIAGPPFPQRKGQWDSWRRSVGPALIYGAFLEICSRKHFPEMASRRWIFGKAKVAAIGPRRGTHARQPPPLPAPL